MSISKTTSTEVLQQVRNEIAEHLASMEAVLLHLDRDPGDLSKLDELFRSMHTVKGIASVLGNPDISTIAHQAESFLETLKKEQRALTPGDLDELLTARDALEKAVNATHSKSAESEQVPDDPEEEAAFVPQFFIFQIGGKLFAFPCGCIREVHVLLPWRVVPFAPPWLCGMASLRGQLLPVLDTGHLLSVPSFGSSRTRIIFAEVENELIGFLVDRVIGVHPLTGWEQSAQAVKFFRLPLMIGAGCYKEQVVTILDPDLLQPVA